MLDTGRVSVVNIQFIAVVGLLRTVEKFHTMRTETGILTNDDYHNMAINISILTVVAAFAGAALGALVQFSWQVYTRHKKRNNLRRSLRAELKSMENINEYELSKVDGKRGASNLLLQTAVYENNTDSIGLLSEGEVDKVLTFYSHAIYTQNQLKNAAQSHDMDKTDVSNDVETLKQNWSEAYDAVDRTPSFLRHLSKNVIGDN